MLNIITASGHPSTDDSGSSSFLSRPPPHVRPFSHSVMDFPPDFWAGKSPRRELQGPRPTPLRVRKDSHKIRKPPVPPPQHPPGTSSLPPPPVIIYTVSPKVIHTNPDDFMKLVQRLTGPDFGSGSGTYAGQFQNEPNGAVSPAALFAAMERTRSPEGKKPVPSGEPEVMVEIANARPERVGFFPGILSPGPASLPPLPPNFFSPLSDQNLSTFFNDLSPVLHSNRTYLEGSFMPSPSNLLSSHITSPTPPFDLFNYYFDL